MKRRGGRLGDALGALVATAALLASAAASALASGAPALAWLAIGAAALAWLAGASLWLALALRAAWRSVAQRGTEAGA